MQPLDPAFLTNSAVDDAVIAFENQYSAYSGSPGPTNNNDAVNQVGTIVWDASTLAEAQQVIQTAHADGSNLVYVTTENDDDFYCPPGDVYAGAPPACTVSFPTIFSQSWHQFRNTRAIWSPSSRNPWSRSVPCRRIRGTRT